MDVHDTYFMLTQSGEPKHKCLIKTVSTAVLEIWSFFTILELTFIAGQAGEGGRKGGAEGGRKEKETFLAFIVHQQAIFIKPEFGSTQGKLDKSLIRCQMF